MARETYEEWQDREYMQELAERRRCIFPNDMAIYAEPKETPNEREKEDEQHE